MELTQRDQLILLGLLLVGLGCAGIYDAVVILPTCRPVLTDVRICTPNTLRIVASSLVGLVGVAVLFINLRTH